MNPPPALKRPATRDEVALEAGVSVATVSMALRGLARVPASTRLRVEGAAERLGYQPNSAASLLAGRRKRAVNAESQILVGWLSNGHRQQDRIASIASTLGLEVRSMHFKSFRSPKEASQMLWQQGVQGVVLDTTTGYPWTDTRQAPFDWSKFSVIKCSRVHPELCFHLVRHSAFDYMTFALNRVLALGYRRVAVLLFPTTSPQDDDARFGALAAIQARRCPAGARLTWRELAPGEFPRLSPEIQKWIHREKPQAILLQHWSMAHSLQNTGITKYPMASVLATPDRFPNLVWVSGCDVQTEEMNRRAMQLLKGLIQNGERGFCQHPTEHVVEPIWIDGETLPPRSR